MGGIAGGQRFENVHALDYPAKNGVARYIAAGAVSQIAVCVVGIQPRSCPIGDEKLAAVLRDNPKKRPAAMVEPDLDMPGIMAKPWIAPIIKASLIEKRSMFLDSSFTQRVLHRTNPVAMSMLPTRPTDEKS